MIALRVLWRELVPRLGTAFFASMRTACHHRAADLPRLNSSTHRTDFLRRMTIHVDGDRAVSQDPT